MNRASICFAYRQNSRAKLLSKKRTWFAEAEATTDAAATDATTAWAADDKGKGAKTPVIPPELQEKMNELAGNARKEGKESGAKEALADFLKKLGYDKPEDVEAAVKAERARIEGEKTELQKEREAREKLEADLKAEREARTALETQRRIDQRDSRIKDALKDSRNPNRVLALMTVEKPEMVKAVMKEDGSIDDKALASLVTTAKGEYKEYFGVSGAGSPSNREGHNPGSDGNGKAAQAQNFSRARRDV